MPAAGRTLAQHLRRGIGLVAVLAVGLTALPLVGLSIYEAIALEDRKRRIAAEFIGHGVAERLQSFEVELDSLASAPAVMTAMMDTAGRQQHLRPLLEQRAQALRASFSLLDHRGRLLFHVAAPGTADLPAADRTRSGAETLPPARASRIEDRRLQVVAPIYFFADHRVIGSLVGEIGLGDVVAAAAQQMRAEFHIRATLSDSVVYASEPGAAPHRQAAALVLPVQDHGAPVLSLQVQAKRSWLQSYAGRVGMVTLLAVSAALLLSVVWGHRISQAIAQPVGDLVRLAARYRHGELPAATPVPPVVELDNLATAIRAAFEAQARAQREALQTTEAMLEGLPVVVFSGRLDAAGGYALDYLGANAARILGQGAPGRLPTADWLPLLDPEQTPAIRQARLGTLEQPHSVIVYRCRDATGGTIVLREQARLLGRHPHGEALVAGTVSDITEEWRLQAQLASAVRLTVVSEMATGLAHELSQPLAAITLIADRTALGLRQNGLDGLARELDSLEEVAKLALQARELVEHLRLFGGADASALTAVTLRAAVDGALGLCGAGLRLSGIGVDVLIPDRLPPVRARQISLEQLLVNVLRNAADALAEAPPSAPRITIIGEASRDAVLLRIRDNGPGIPASVLPHIFEPFFTTRQIGKRIGLGLSICHSIMQAFGGRIEVTNHREGGAEVTLSFAPQPPAETMTAGRPP